MTTSINSTVQENPTQRPPASAARLDGVPTTGAESPMSATTLADRFQATLPKLDPKHPEYVVKIVDHLLRFAQATGGSDIHLTPAENALEIDCRIDGVLVPMAEFPRLIAPNIAARLKVLAELLTYKTDVPQEGRIQPSNLVSVNSLINAGTVADAASVGTRSNPVLVKSPIDGLPRPSATTAAAEVLPPDNSTWEMRVSTFPTLFGEKAVVRIFAGSNRYQFPSDLGLPEDIGVSLSQALQETAGALIITGPAGSGKTTTAYACLREIQRQHRRGKSLVTLEDPIETVLPGVAQSQVKRNAGFDYAVGLRSMMRQDPDVILVGEIRDRETAETVFQACLTGHLVISTFHAGSACEAISRLNDMGIEPYLLRTGLRSVLSQRLIRQLCDCAVWSDDPGDLLGFGLSRVRVPVGCPRCAGTGYHQRILVAEMLHPNQKDVGRAILSKFDADDLQETAMAAGLRTLGQRAMALIEAGRTSPVEIRRVLGFRNAPHVPAAIPDQGREP